MADNSPAPDPAPAPPSDRLDHDALLADLADYVHTATTHAGSGVCNGDNDGCEGGPDRVDLEAADRIYDHLVSLGLVRAEAGAQS